MLRRKRTPASELEKIVSGLGSGALVDYLKRYTNSLGNSVRHFEDTGDPLALDVIQENTEAVALLAQELRNRVKDFTPPAPDFHLQMLVREFERRYGATPPGVPSRP